MVQHFTLWQIEVDIFRTVVENYRDANNMKIYLPWEPGSNWQAVLSLAQLAVIQATNEKVLASIQWADTLAPYH